MADTHRFLYSLSSELQRDLDLGYAEVLNLNAIPDSEPCAAGEPAQGHGQGLRVTTLVELAEADAEQTS